MENTSNILEWYADSDDAEIRFESGYDSLESMANSDDTETVVVNCSEDGKLVLFKSDHWESCCGSFEVFDKDLEIVVASYDYETDDEKDVAGFMAKTFYQGYVQTKATIK